MVALRAVVILNMITVEGNYVRYCQNFKKRYLNQILEFNWILESCCTSEIPDRVAPILESPKYRSAVLHIAQIHPADQIRLLGATIVTNYHTVLQLHIVH